MTKHLLTSLLTFLLLFIGSFSYAQDIIVLKDGEKIKARIVEVTSNVIKYNEYDDPNQILFSIDRATIREIRYEYGKKQREEAPGINQAYYADDKKNNLKLNFSALGNATTIFIYERALNPFSSVEGSLKINGLGVNNDDDRSGVGFAAGYKVKLASLFKDRNQYRPNHILHGGYLRPSIGFNIVNFDDTQSFLNSYSYVHFGIDIGKQWILQNRLSLDLFIGLHYYGGSVDRRFSSGFGDDFDLLSIEDGNFFGENNVATSAGIRIGFLFGKSSDEVRRR